MSEFSIDEKQKQRGASARGRRKTTLTAPTAYPTVSNEDDDNGDNQLNIRVKDRSGGDTSSGKKGRIGGLFKETPIRGFKEGAAESMKRPLTGMANLFRRPGSRAGRKRDEDEDPNFSSSVPSYPVHNAQLSTTASTIALAGRPISPSPLGGNVTPPAMGGFDAVARAPHLSSAQLHGLLQPDSMATKHPHLARIDDIDLTLLSRFLCTEEEVQDEETSWTWDYLFASVSSEMREEWALDESEDR